MKASAKGYIEIIVKQEENDINDKNEVYYYIIITVLSENESWGAL